MTGTCRSVQDTISGECPRIPRFFKEGSFLPGVGRIDEPDTCCGGFSTPTSPCAMPRRRPKRYREALRPRPGMTCDRLQIRSQNLSD